MAGWPASMNIASELNTHLKPLSWPHRFQFPPGLPFLLWRRRQFCPGRPRWRRGRSRRCSWPLAARTTTAGKMLALSSNGYCVYVMLFFCLGKKREEKFSINFMFWGRKLVVWVIKVGFRCFGMFDNVSTWWWKWKWNRNIISKTPCVIFGRMNFTEKKNTRKLVNRFGAILSLPHCIILGVI